MCLGIVSEEEFEDETMTMTDDYSKPKCIYNLKISYK